MTEGSGIHGSRWLPARQSSTGIRWSNGGHKEGGCPTNTSTNHPYTYLLICKHAQTPRGSSDKDPLRLRCYAICPAKRFCRLPEAPWSLWYWPSPGPWSKLNRPSSGGLCVSAGLHGGWRPHRARSAITLQRHRLAYPLKRSGQRRKQPHCCHAVYVSLSIRRWGCGRYCRYKQIELS